MFQYPSTIDTTLSLLPKTDDHYYVTNKRIYYGTFRALFMYEINDMIIQHNAYSIRSTYRALT